MCSRWTYKVGSWRKCGVHRATDSEGNRGRDSNLCLKENIRERIVVRTVDFTVLQIMKENVEVVHVDVGTVSRWWSRGLRVVFSFLGERESQGVCARRLAQQKISRVTS